MSEPSFAEGFRRGYDTGVDVERKRCAEISNKFAAKAEEYAHAKDRTEDGPNFHDGAHAAGVTIAKMITEGK